jgi:hypothetical protein
MKFDWSFPRQILLALVIVTGISAYPLTVYGDHEMIVAAISGAVVMTVNVLLGYAAIEYSYGKSTTVFFQYVLGGMGVRMLFMASAVVVFIRLLHLHIGALMTSMVVLYIIFLTLEIFYIQKKVHIKQQS